MDNINIEQIDGSGSLERWANEKTQDQIKVILSEIAKALDIDEKTQEEGFLALKESVEKGTDKEEKAAKENAKALKGMKAGLASEAKSFTSFLGVEYEGEMSKIVNGVFGPMIEKNPILKAGLGAFAVGLDTAVGALKTITGTYTDSFKAGTMFKEGVEGGMTAFQAYSRSAADMRINFEDISKITGEYSLVMNQVGITTFSKFQQDIAGAGKLYGITTLDAANQLADYLEIQRLNGTLDEAQRNLEAGSAREVIERNEKYSKTLGISTDELIKQRLEVAKDIDVQRALRNVKGFKSKEAVKEGISNLKASGLEDISNLIKVGLDTPAKMEKVLAETFKGQFMPLQDTIRSIVERGRSGELEGVDVMAEITSATENMAAGNREAYAKSLDVMQMSPVLEGAATLVEDIFILSDRLIEQQNAIKVEDKEGKKTGKPATDAVVEATTDVRNLMINLENIIVKKFGKLVATIGEEKYFKMISNAAVAVDDSFTNIEKNIKEFVKSFGQSVGLFQDSVWEMKGEYAKIELKNIRQLEAKLESVGINVDPVSETKKIGRGGGQTKLKTQEELQKDTDRLRDLYIAKLDSDKAEKAAAEKAAAAKEASFKASNGYIESNDAKNKKLEEENKTIKLLTGIETAVVGTKQIAKDHRKLLKDQRDQIQ